MNIRIVHGTASKPERSWFPWLTWQLIQQGHSVVVPRLPTPEGQNYRSWRKAFESQTPVIDEQTILIGHSTGTIFLLRYLSESTTIRSIAGLVLVSAFVRPLKLPEHPELEPLIDDFVDVSLDWEKINQIAKVKLCYHGDDDPIVPLAMGQEVAAQLKANLTVLHHGQHLNSDAGFFEFPQLYDGLQKSLLGL